MTAPDPALRLLELAGVTSDAIDATDIARVCALLGLDEDDPITEEVTDEIARLGEATWPAGTVPPDEYGFRIGKWRIEVGRHGVHAGILTAFAAAALIQRGVAEIGVAVVTAVLPTVLVVERIELSAGDRRLLIDLQLRPAVRDGFMTEDELYASLPDDARRSVNRYDFADFVGRLRDAGLVEGSDAWLRVRDPDAKGPLISLR